MGLYRVAGVSLIALYSLLVGYAGLQQLRQKRIQVWAVLGMLVIAFALLVAGYLLSTASPLTMIMLVGALVAMHALAVNSGLHMHGKINPGHHLARAVVSLVLILLAYLSLSRNRSSRRTNPLNKKRPAARPGVSGLTAKQDEDTGRQRQEA